MSKLVTWMRNLFNSGCTGYSTTDLWYDATEEERVALSAYLRRTTVRVGSFDI